MWVLYYAHPANMDARKLAVVGLKQKALALFNVIRNDSYQNPPAYEKLVGDLSGAYSRRSSHQYPTQACLSSIRKRKIVKVSRLWAHYE